MAIRNYQTTIVKNNLYATKLASPSGLGEALKPRITVLANTGGNVTLYGSEDEPTGLTLANIATKMAVIKDDVVFETFDTIPNFLVAVEKTATLTDITITSIYPGARLGVIS